MSARCTRRKPREMSNRRSVWRCREDICSMQRQGKQANAIVNSLFDSLTPREQEVMRLVTTGIMNKQVAAEMGVSMAPNL
jgi:FixJ family two-component response regulator